jgi:hypothetical protein
MIAFSTWIAQRSHCYEGWSVLARALLREAQSDPAWPRGASYAATRAYVLARHTQAHQRRRGQLPEDGSDWFLGHRAVFSDTLLDALVELFRLYNPRDVGTPATDELEEVGTWA